jgi:phage terminase large subunit-like protein
VAAGGVAGEADPRDRVLLLTPKGAGKTELSGAIAVIEMLNRESAEVVIAAATWHQVGLLKASADGCCTHPNSALASFVEVTEAEIRLKNTTSRIIRVASDAGANDGLRPTALIRDEVHEWNTPSRERNHMILSNGLAKRGGLQMDISTVGGDRDSLLGRYDTYCRRVAAGEIEDEHLLYVCYSAEGLELDLDSEEGLRTAILAANPSARGPEPFVDLDEVARRFREVPRAEGRRYFLNIWGEGGSVQWLPEGAWAPLADPVRVIKPRSAVFLGFDGSATSDSTAIVMIGADKKPPHAVLLGCWERPKDAREGWVVPRSEVNECVAYAFDTFAVKAFYCDPWQWWEEIKEWEKRYGETKVIRFKTNKVEQFGEACDLLWSSVVNAELSHDGSTILARHLRNAVPRVGTDGRRTTIGKVHKSSDKTIDAAVALCLARAALGDYEPATPRVHDMRALIEDSEEGMYGHLVNPDCPKCGSGSARGKGRAFWCQACDHIWRLEA